MCEKNYEDNTMLLLTHTYKNISLLGGFALNKTLPHVCGLIQLLVFTEPASRTVQSVSPEDHVSVCLCDMKIY